MSEIKSFKKLAGKKQQSNLSGSNTICEIVKMDLWTHYSVELLFINVAIGAFCHPLSQGRRWGSDLWPRAWVANEILQMCNIHLKIWIQIVYKMCFDSKVVDDPKRFSCQLISSKVNIFLLRVDLCIQMQGYNCRTCDFEYLDIRIRKTKK